MHLKKYGILLSLAALFVLASGLFYQRMLCPPTGSQRVGTLRLKPFGPENEKKFGSLLGQRTFRYSPELKANRLPEGVQDVKLGEFALDCVNPVLFAAYPSEAGKPLDTLIFDLNGDRDLTNDPKFSDPSFSSRKELSSESGKDIALQLPNGPTIKLRVDLSLGFAARFTTNLWLRGKILLEDKKFDVALFSTNEKGLAPGNKRGAPFLLLDANGNGKFEADLFRMDSFGKESFYLTSGTNILGTLYDYTFDKENLALQFTRYTGPQGKLDLKPEFALKVKSWHLVCEFLDEQQEIAGRFAGTDKGSPIAVKAGNFRISDGYLTLKMADGKNIQLEFSNPEPLKIKDGETVTLQFEDPDPLELTLKQADDTLTIGRIFKSRNGIEYGRVQTISEKPEDAQNPTAQTNGGQIVIRDAQGKQIGEGALEYG